CSVGSSRIPAVSSAYISATRRGVSRKPSRSGSSPMPSRIRRTPRARRTRSTLAGPFFFSNLDILALISSLVPCYWLGLLSSKRFSTEGSGRRRLLKTLLTENPVATARGSVTDTQRALLPALLAAVRLLFQPLRGTDQTQA